VDWSTKPRQAGCLALKLDAQVPPQASSLLKETTMLSKNGMSLQPVPVGQKPRHGCRRRIEQDDVEHMNDAQLERMIQEFGLQVDRIDWRRRQLRRRRWMVAEALCEIGALL
jgi:hypothetical protein